MTHNGKFGEESVVDQVKMAKFGHFAGFSPKVRLGLTRKWPISPNSQLFPSFDTKAYHFWRTLKNFHFWGEGTLANFFEFFNFFESFHTKKAPNDPQWQIWSKRWFKWGQNGQFWSFCRFFPQSDTEIDSEWPISLDSQLFPSFASQPSHFWRNLKNFHFWGRG